MGLLKIYLPAIGITLLSGCVAIPDNHADDDGDHVETQKMMMDRHSEAKEGHGHKAWMPPPAAYQNMVNSNGWKDHDAAERGEKIYKVNCVSCHGTSGVGDGVLAQSLQHPPANLTNHFHQAPGEGDSYLFWRISEGGTAAPFRQAASLMPAFKSVLSENERWDVLTYVHQQFHRGFKVSSMEAEPSGHGSEPSDHDSEPSGHDSEPSDHG